MNSRTPILKKTAYRQIDMLLDLAAYSRLRQRPSKAKLADPTGTAPTKTVQGRVRSIEEMMRAGLIVNKHDRPDRYALELTALGRAEVAYWSLVRDGGQ